MYSDDESHGGETKANDGFLKPVDYSPAKEMLQVGRRNEQNATQYQYMLKELARVKTAEFDLHMSLRLGQAKFEVLDEMRMRTPKISLIEPPSMYISMETAISKLPIPEKIKSLHRDWTLGMLKKKEQISAMCSADGVSTDELWVARQQYVSKREYKHKDTIYFLKNVIVYHQDEDYGSESVYYFVNGYILSYETDPKAEKIERIVVKVNVKVRVSFVVFVVFYFYSSLVVSDSEFKSFSESVIKDHTSLKDISKANANVARDTIITPTMDIDKPINASSG